MAFRELKGFLRETFLDAKIEQLQRVYRRAQKDLARKLKVLEEAGRLSDFQRNRLNALLIQINQEVNNLNQLSRSWVKRTIPQAYMYGVDISEERLRALGVTKYVNFDARIHRSAIAVLIDDVTVDLVAANVALKKNLTRFIRMTQQKVLEDAQISKLIAQGAIQGETRREISGRILEEFKKRVGEERMITINGRNYTPDYYSRLVARSRYSEAANQANVNTALQYGLDLVQVSVHSGSCPICNPYQGKIYSISGNDPDFPPLETRPPYHPNCRHQLLPITKESLEDRGLLKQSIRFSNETNQPGVKNFREFEEHLHA